MRWPWEPARRQRPHTAIVVDGSRMDRQQAAADGCVRPMAGFVRVDHPLVWQRVLVLLVGRATAPLAPSQVLCVLPRLIRFLVWLLARWHTAAYSRSRSTA